MMKKFLYMVLLLFVLIGCTSNEQDEFNNSRNYKVTDLVEIASEYGIIFQPQKEFGNVRLSQNDIDSFRVQVNRLREFKGKYIFDSYVKTSHKGVLEKYSNQFTTRSNRDSLYSDTYDFKTSYYNSYYACNCTVEWSIIYAENGEYLESYTGASVSVLNQLDGMSASDSMNSEFDKNISFVPWLEAIEFQGSLLVPYRRANLPIGYFSLGYYGCVMPHDLNGSFIKWG